MRHAFPLVCFSNYGQVERQEAGPRPEDRGEGEADIQKVAEVRQVGMPHGRLGDATDHVHAVQDGDLRGKKSVRFFMGIEGYLRR